MLYFYGDPHFGDDAIRQYENRPYADVKEMDAAFIKNYNDIIYQAKSKIHDIIKIKLENRGGKI